MKQLRKRHFLAILMLLLAINSHSTTPKKSWQNDVGAQSYPNTENVFWVNDFGANNKGLILSTKAIQAAIDQCAKAGGGKVVFKPGSYLSGSIFVKSKVDLCIGEGVEIRGVIDLKEYPRIASRIAGIEMEWPAALINIIDQEDAAVSGTGSVHAQGRYHWERYWQLRQEYTPKGLRWAADYDCERVRTLLVSNAKNITIKDLH